MVVYKPRNALKGIEACVFIFFHFQVDLLSVTTVEGIVIFNWVETENYSFENVYSVETHIRGCQSFIVEHGISKDSFVQLSKEPFTIDKSREVEEPRTIIFYESFPARYLRLYPLGHDNRKPVCLKLELLGCRKRGTLSLSCHQNQHRDIFETDQIFIPSSNKIETRFNMSYSDCQDFCLYNRTECVGIDLSNSTCKLFMSDERQSYKRLQSNSGAATAPCWQGLLFLYRIYTSGVLLETIYFNIFEDSLLNTQDKRIVVNNFSVLTSVGYPFRYDDNQVDRWNISSATGKLITLQFTDISLKTYDRVEDSRLFQNKGLCKDEIIVTTKETYRIANHSEGIIYSFDNKYNGKYPNAPVPYSNIFLEFRTCTQRQTDAQLYRGFTVYIFEEDSRHICLPDIFCETSPMELSSGSFLGHLLLDVDMVIEWYIDHAYKHSVRFELLDFDISCSSGTQFIITAASTYTGTWQKTFCNGNRTYGAFQVDGDFFFVQFYTALETCGQLLFQEGFRLSFRTPESKDKLMNLTTFQTEIIDNLPIMVTITSFPIQKADASTDKFNEGRVRIVCSDTFKKCYTIYIGMPPMSWMDSMNMCRQRNKTLVRFRSKLEMEYVRQAVSAWMIDIDIPVLRYFYYSIRLIIGLTRFAINNQRYRDYWSDGSLAEFTAWDMNEPKDVYFRRCTSMSLSDNRGWKTENCDEMSLVNIVCETATTQDYKGTGSTVLKIPNFHSTLACK
ncbi:uncharacterized protein LOC123539273 [Mercenaria mercenaria]|uniref:uncharacterized protein LOC123539273 n=1 Tax=Mercenaria mercenaria TaxID=6596 RepID=UPI00234F2CF8|nr:uncharacterized protein LOC123539273 [Mercenaria mercenaria]